ncbi:FAD:protein FMN transferase [Microvirga ossetica]|uniref:FAD:protein FMN transferase n=1 Tax=Microvirga ossetica TaxID=1882682 RepID=UPI00157044CF|nr:FAD:protein FMN transferase [Microvirga ossetica]
MIRFTFEAIGTAWEIETPSPLEIPARRRILERIERFDVTYSRFRSDSLVSRIASSPEGGRFTLPEDSIKLFDLYDRLNACTDGAVDPLVGRDLELLGYDRTYSLTPDITQLRSHSLAWPRWSNDVRREGASLVTRCPLVIDIGAVGKGYLIDLIAAMLREEGHTSFVVDGSGDLLHSGPSPLRIGLEHPFDARLAIGVVDLKDRALCASAVNRRAWGDQLHHVIDGRTGMPTHDVVATWVVADDAATADGLATALFFTPAERLAPAFPFSWVRMFADGRAEISTDFDGELFT